MIRFESFWCDYFSWALLTSSFLAHHKLTLASHTQFPPHNYLNRLIGQTNNNTMIESTYTKSRCNECLASLQAMLAREEKSYECSSSCSDSDYSDVRRSLVDVYDEVFDMCQLQNRDTVAVAISYLDRFMSVQTRFVNVQLAAMTCFYLAVKLYEPTVIPPAMLVELFQRTLDCGDDEELDDDASTDTVMTAGSVESMERTLLSALKWNLNPPTPMMFVRQLLSCLPDAHLGQWKEAALDLAEAHFRVAVKCNETVNVPASTQAVAALFLAVEKLPVSRRASVYKFLLQAVGMTSAELQRQVLTVQGLLKQLVSQAVEDVCTPEVVKRPAFVIEDLSYDHPAKRQRLVGKEVSFTSSPRSTLFPFTMLA